MKNFLLVTTWFLVGLLLHTVMVGKDLQFSAPMLALELLSGLIQLTDFKKKTNVEEVPGL